MSEPRVLHRAAAPIALPDALGLIAPVHASFTWLLLMGPRRARIVRLGTDGVVVDENGARQETDDVFEARAFGPRAELRWVRDGNTGRGALLSEDAVLAAQLAQPEELATDDQIHQTYLLWGEVDGYDRDGRWAFVSAARIGRLAIPVTAEEPARRLMLRTVEYVCSDQHGNGYVGEELLRDITRAAED